MDIFVIISAKTCVHCKKVNISEIKELVEDRRMTFIEYETDKMFSSNGEKGKYPESLGALGWHPFIFCTTSDVWEKIKSGKDLRNKITIFNGYFNEKEYIPGIPVYDHFDVNSINTWLNDVENNQVVPIVKYCCIC